MTQRPKDPKTQRLNRPLDTANRSLGDDISCLNGIGPKRADALRDKGINTIKDLLFFFPVRYEDRRKVTSISELEVGREALLWGRVLSAGEEQISRAGKKIFRIELGDNTGVVDLVWFNYSRLYLRQLAKTGATLSVYGKVRLFRNRLQVVHPQAEVTDAPRRGSLEPVYPGIKGIPQKVLKVAIRQAVSQWLTAVSDPLPYRIREEIGLPGLKETIKILHFPSLHQDVTSLNEAKSKYHQRIRFDRFLTVLLAVLIKKYQRAKGREKSSYVLPNDFLERFETLLPFHLTDDQVEAIHRIIEDFRSDQPMNRLLQGDVGCGKTVVCAAAAFAAVLNRRQVAVMAPTQILAKQHHDFFSSLPKKLGFRTGLLTGALENRQRQRLYKEIRHGDCNLVIGTQALIQKEVRFHNLGLIIIDEQHRFGVRQRALLAEKGDQPHVLVMTATPIPRTLAIVLYADMDISVIRARPPGYKGVLTRIVKETEKRKIYDIVTARMGRGEQVIVVCPVIEGSEDQDLKNAIEMYHGLERIYGNRFSVSLIHGGLSPGDKDLIMEDFRKGKIQLLVATTVVEVGVHAPGATVLVVEHPERFGLSQLHQLRGRVGRGEREGLCLLIRREGISEQAEKRLKILASCQDGFLISEQDLLMRGHGELVGLRQSGPGELDMTEVITNPNLLMAAKAIAERILARDPGLSHGANALLRKQLEDYYGIQLF